MDNMHSDQPSKKAQCKQIMLELLGPLSASKVDAMSEDDCVQQCQKKIESLLGERLAARFDEIN